MFLNIINEMLNLQIKDLFRMLIFSKGHEAKKILLPDELDTIYNQNSNSFFEVFFLSLCSK